MPKTAATYTDTNRIDIAFDRANGRYVAYNIHTGIFATGVCVESACEEYRNKYYARSYEGMHSLPDNEMYGGSLGG